MFTIKQGDYTITKSMRMPSRMVERLERIAEENNISFTELILQCLDYAMANIDPEHNAEKPTKAK